MRRLIRTFLADVRPSERRMVARRRLGPFRAPSALFVALLACGVARCGAPPTPVTRSAVVKPSKAQLALCQGFVDRMAACSRGTLTVSPNDAPRCGGMLASHDNNCHVAFEDLTACVKGVTCNHLWQGACLANYSVSTAVCEGFLAPEAYDVLGMTTR